MSASRNRARLAGWAIALALAASGRAGEISKRWVFEAVSRPELPAVKRDEWARGPIDRFILERLESSGLEPAPEASRLTLIRRLSFDLLGLPPSPEEVDAFVQDGSPGAYERLVERFLSSPRHGERWARHWLDAARYCESHGFEYDKLRPNAWHYRDYVLCSFNDDKPYDVFVKEQLAGDAIEPTTSDGIAATGFLVAGPWDEANNAQANVTLKAVGREDELEDMVSAVAQTFLGLTVNCARCHDHKFDPIPQEDYYRLRSVLSGVRHGETSLWAPDEARAHEAEKARLQIAIASASQRVAAIDAAALRAVLSRRKPQGTLPDALQVPRPILRWTFDRDSNDALQGLESTLEGGAEVKGGRLLLRAKGAFLRSAPLPRDIREKTLEAWVVLSGLEQGGGGVVSIEKLDGSTFDAIVYGEREPRKWTAGSNSFVRTKDLDASGEAAAPGELVHVALVFGADNRIALYRNGKPYGSSYSVPAESGLVTFKGGESRALIGLRHTGGGNAFLTGEIEEAALYDRGLSAEEVARSYDASAFGVSDRELLSALSESELSERVQGLRQIAELRGALEAESGKPLSYSGGREQPAPTRLLVRGDVLKPSKELAPAGLSAVPIPRADFGLKPDAPEAERRRRLADWVIDARNPLTARVIANRIWSHHFGQGIVATPNDFGAAGARPSHPELLDWLASELIARGWSLKSLHRAIVTSATYRQASTWNPRGASADAENQLLWRCSPRRIEAEAVRDAMLVASGEINWMMGGPSFRDFEFIAFPASVYAPIDRDDPDLKRRTIYRMNVQSGKNPLLEAFDCPEPSVKTPRRGITTTPIQALGLMNSTFVNRQAARLAARARKESDGTDAKSIDRAWALVLGRSPTPQEAESAARIARTQGLETVCWTLFNSSELLYAD